MKKLIGAVLIIVALSLATVSPAFAKVHAVSQAPCGASANSGGIASGGNSPAGPIPITVGGLTGPSGPGNLDGVNGNGCDTPAGDVRQNP